MRTLRSSESSVFHGILIGTTFPGYDRGFRFRERYRPGCATGSKNKVDDPQRLSAGISLSFCARLENATQM
jgi:hypothetical protein